MKRRILSISSLLVLLSLTCFLSAKDRNPKPGPLTGTWDCRSHGASSGDMQFTLTLEQDKDTVTGSVSSPIGSAELSDATYSKKTLEIHIESDQDAYVLTGKLKNGKLTGEWSHGNEKGAWEGTKEAPTPSK